MRRREFQFDWDERKAAANRRKHRVSFDLASTIFADPRVLTVPDIDHGEGEERWLSIGCDANGAILTVIYLWTEGIPPVNKIRVISARKSTLAEISYYQEGA